MTALGQMATTSPLCGAEARPAVYIMQSRHPTAVGNVPTRHWQGEGRSPPHQRAQLGLRRAHTLGVSRAKGSSFTVPSWSLVVGSWWQPLAQAGNASCKELPMSWLGPRVSRGTAMWIWGCMRSFCPASSPECPQCWGGMLGRL